MKKLTTLLPFVLLLLISCNNKKNEMLTVIHKDGSCSREFEAKADSAFMTGNMAYNPFPVVFDSTWKITYSVPSGKTDSVWPVKRWNYPSNVSKKDTIQNYPWIKIKKDFASVEEMGRTLRFDNSGWMYVIPKVKLEKHFRWFYTVYDYEEIYPKYNMLNDPPIKDFLTDDEIRVYTSENPVFERGLTGKEIKDMLDGIEIKINDWLNQNFFRKNLYLMAVEIEKDPAFPVRADRFRKAIDSLKSDKSFPKILEYDSAVYAHLDQFFHVHAFQNFEKTHEDFEKKGKEWSDSVLSTLASEFSYRLLMPGKVTETNSINPQTDTLQWNVNGERFFLTDYRIYAHSRNPNVWAFILSGIIVLAAILSFTVRRRNVMKK